MTTGNIVFEKAYSYALKTLKLPEKEAEQYALAELESYENDLESDIAREIGLDDTE